MTSVLISRCVECIGWCIFMYGFVIPYRMPADGLMSVQVCFTTRSVTMLVNDTIPDLHLYRPAHIQTCRCANIHAYDTAGLICFA